MQACTPRVGRIRGFTLIELMVSLTLGLILMAGLVSVFVNSSRTNREHQRASEQIENGRYASDVLLNDLHHAGYYGDFFNLPDMMPFPDPCAVSNVGGTITNSLPYAIQGFGTANYTSVPDLSGTSCGTWLTAGNLQPGSDVLVVRRVDTAPLAVGDIAEANAVYLQTNPFEAEIQFGNGQPITSDSRADGTAATVLKRDLTAGDIRKFIVHVYFVAPCSVPADGTDICKGAGDDGGRPIPTLKRLELDGAAGATTMRIQTVSEGIELLKLDYGIDAVPAVPNDLTGSFGDGAPESYTRAPTADEFRNVVTVRVNVLARNTEATLGFVDTKMYRLGLAGDLAARNDAFKRHAYTDVVRIVNASGRREIPQ